MCKFQPFQVWQAAGLSLGSPLPHAVGNHFPSSSLPAAKALQLPCGAARAPENPLRKPLAVRPGRAPLRGTIVHACPPKRRKMHHKEPAQTIKCVKIYTNASLLYVRSTL